MMTRLLFSTLIAAAGCSSCSASEQKVAALQNTRLPATLCLALDATTGVGLSKGDIRLKVKIRNQHALSRYSSAFQLFLVQENGRRLLLQSFGLQPDRQEQGAALPQQIQLALQDQPLVPDRDGLVCFELTQESSAGSTEHLEAKDVAISWYPLPPHAGN